MKYIVALLGFCLSLMACAAPQSLPKFAWDYGTGSNIDLTKNTKTEFYLGGKLVYVDSLAGGGAGGLLADRIKGHQLLLGWWRRFAYGRRLHTRQSRDRNGFTP